MYSLSEIAFLFTEPYIHWVVIDDLMTNQVQPRLVSVNISHFRFDRQTVFSSQGVATFNNCVISAKTFVLDLFRSKNHLAPSYLTRIHILPHLKENQFKFIKTKFEGESGQDVNVFFHSYNGAREVFISDCSLNNTRLYLNIGNQSLAMGSHFEITVLKIKIDDTYMGNTVVRIHTSSQQSFGSVSVTNGVLHDAFIWKYRPGGFVGVMCENCTFSASEENNKPRGICLIGAIFVTVKNSKFQINDARSFEGSAVQMKGADMLFEIQEVKEMVQLLSCPSDDCKFETETLEIMNTEFEGSIHTHASTVHCTNANLVLENCSFRMSNISKVEGYIHYAVGYRIQFVRVVNVTLDAKGLSTETSIMDFLSGTAYFENIDILCPSSLAVEQTIEEYVHQYLCKFHCPDDYYTFEAGSLKLNGHSGRDGILNGTIDSIEPNCLPCPVGAKCGQQVRPLPNYWGLKEHNNVVKMLRCPDGYCCEGPESCKSIDSCNTGRTGTLCGTCGPNLTESLLSPKCVSSNSCHGNRIVMLYIMCAISYAVILVIAKDIKNAVIIVMRKMYRGVKKFCKHSKVEKLGDDNEGDNINIESQSTINKSDNNIGTEMKVITETYKNDLKEEKCSSEKEDTKTMRKGNEESSTKYLQILFYYVQDAVLFKIFLPHENEESETISVKVLKFSPTFLSMYLSLSEQCFAAGTTAVTKVLFKSFFGPCVMLFLFLIYLCQRGISQYCFKHAPSWLIFRKNLIQAFLLAFLFSYQEMVIGAFTLLKCVQVEQSKVLYVQGIIHCYQWWQIGVKIYTSICVLPVFFILSHCSFYVKDNSMPTTTFVLACVFPLPVLSYFLLAQLLGKCRHRKNEFRENKKPITQRREREEYSEVISDILLEHYRCLKLCGFRFTWLGVHKLYRVLLVICNTYITTPMTRLLIMTTILIHITVANILMKPYKGKRANQTASVSYITNLCIAIINLSKTMMSTFGCESNCFLRATVLQYMELTENMLLNWVPWAAVIVWVLHKGMTKCCLQTKHD